jgi:hypothetical protein
MNKGKGPERPLWQLQLQLRAEQMIREGKMPSLQQFAAALIEVARKIKEERRLRKEPE